MYGSLSEIRILQLYTDDTSTAFLGKNRKKKFNLNVMCYRCNEKGHVQKNCPKLTEDRKKMAELKKTQAHIAAEDFSFISSIETALKTISKGSWLADSGVMSHIVQDRHHFLDLI